MPGAATKNNRLSFTSALAANGKGLVLDCSWIREYCRAYKGNNYQEADFKRILGIVEGALVSPKRSRLSAAQNKAFHCERYDSEMHV